MVDSNVQVPSKLILEDLFIKHYKEWCFLSFSYLENMFEAEDIVKDVLEKMFQKEDIHQILYLKSYINRAVKNASLKRILKGKQEFINEIIGSNAKSHELDLIALEEKETVRKALKLLPEKSRMVFKLCVLENFTYKEAAIHLNISKNTIKFHLKKSFKILRLQLCVSFFDY